MLGNGSYRVRNSEDGADLVENVKVIRGFCFAMEIREWAKRLLGDEDYSARREA